MRFPAFTLLFAGTTTCLAPACGGRAEQPNADGVDTRTPSGTGGEGEIATGGQFNDGDVSDGGVSDGDDDDVGVGEPSRRTGGFGGQPPTVDLDLWCPVGDEWESLFGPEAENLGGAPPAEQCPDLPRLEYSVSYCLAIFSSEVAVVSPETESCCYAIESIHCR